MNVTKALTEREWRAPQGFVILGPDDLVRLGADGSGREWFRHRKGELRARPTLLDDRRDVLPDRPLRKVGASTYEVFDWMAPGSFAQTAAPRPVAPPKPVKLRRLDVFAATLLDGIHGPAEAHARLEHKLGARISAHPTIPGGLDCLDDRNDGRLRAVLAIPGLTRWLWLHLTGQPTPCEVGGHDAQSVTVAVGGLAVCADCLGGAS